ncbi:hypothetical protein QF040_001375 [Variovorax sp. W2I14]
MSELVVVCLGIGQPASQPGDFLRADDFFIHA